MQDLSYLIPELLKVTQNASISCFPLIGKKNEKEADRLAVNSMRNDFNKLDINGRIVIGEGERDEAPMLYIGEEVGTKNGPEIDIAVDPLEGTTILANAWQGALCVIAVSKKGGLLNAPDVYMDKIAIGFHFPEKIISLDNSVKENLTNIALAKKCNISDLVVTILDRSRHEELIAKTKELGAKAKLIGDGDIAAVLETSGYGNADVYMGVGGAPEGALAASALKTIGGQMCGRLLFRTDEEKERAKKAGLSDLSKQYCIEDMVKHDAIFLATGATDGPLLKGVHKAGNAFVTETLVMNSFTKTVEKISKSI